MDMKGNRPIAMWSEFAWLGAVVVVLNCTAAIAQPRAGARSGQPEGAWSAQAGKPGPPGRGFGPRNGPGLQGPAGRPRPWNTVPEPERRQVERFMEEHFPRLYVEMQKLKDRDEVRYARRMTRITPQMRKIMETMRTDPQRGTLLIRERQLEFEIQQTIASFRSAKDDAAKQQIREHLEGLVGKAFDCRNERRQTEVRELEARLNELQTRLSESDKMRPALIRQRVSELLEHPAPKPDGGKDDDRETHPEEPESEPD